MDISVFEALGPVMVGPSSSHTAGAARLASIAAKAVQGNFHEVEFILHGSFAKTYLGHGTDRALVAGALDLAPDDERLPDAFELARERGLKYSFAEQEMRDVHENTVRIVFHMDDGRVSSVTGSSIGGGQIVISSINGFDVEYTAQSSALIITQYDRKGVISRIAGVLAQNDVNIGVMRLSRRAKGDVACSIIEVDAQITPKITGELSALGDVISVCAINI